MGTHPIFESDFDCLTDSVGDSLMDKKGRKRKKKNDYNRNCQDIRSFFRPIPKVEKTDSVLLESSKLTEAVTEAPSVDDEDDGFYVAAPHIVNSPPKLSPIPLIEDTPPPSPDIQSTSNQSQNDSSTEYETDSDDDDSVKSLPTALQFRFDLASINDADMPELEPIEYKNDSEDEDTIEMFRNPSNENTNNSSSL